MKLLFVDLARTIWLFDTRLLNPQGMSLQGFIEGLAKKYEFAAAPKNQLDLSEDKALVFKAGTFINSRKIPILTSFTLYADGIVSDTFSSTDDSTEFLTQVAEWMKAEFGLVIPPHIKKGHVSQIDVECQTPLLALNPGLARLLKRIDRSFQPLDGKQRAFDVGGVSFWTEDVTMPYAPAVFKFERKWKSQFALNHYFSQAPFETSTHLEVLNELEQLLKA